MPETTTPEWQDHSEVQPSGWNMVFSMQVPGSMLEAQESGAIAAAMTAAGVVTADNPPSGSMWDESKWRHGRPVISREMMMKMKDPLPPWD